MKVLTPLEQQAIHYSLKYTLKNNFRPTPALIAKELGIEPDEAEDLEKALFKKNLRITNLELKYFKFLLSFQKKYTPTLLEAGEHLKTKGQSICRVRKSLYEKGCLIKKNRSAYVPFDQIEDVTYVAGADIKEGENVKIDESTGYVMPQ